MTIAELIKELKAFDPTCIVAIDMGMGTFVEAQIRFDKELSVVPVGQENELRVATATDEDVAGAVVLTG